MGTWIRLFVVEEYLEGSSYETVVLLFCLYRSCQSPEHVDGVPLQSALVVALAQSDQPMEVCAPYWHEVY
jgi:hypothetical protein